MGAGMIAHPGSLGITYFQQCERCGVIGVVTEKSADDIS